MACIDADKLRSEGEGDESFDGMSDKSGQEGFGTCLDDAIPNGFVGDGVLDGFEDPLFDCDGTDDGAALLPASVSFRPACGCEVLVGVSGLAALGAAVSRGVSSPA
jgi:hypothetical protein